MFIKRRELTAEESMYVSNIYLFAKKDEDWANEILKPMFALDEKMVEVEHLHMGYPVEPVKSYSRQMFVSGNANTYRSKAFCGFDRFADNSSNSGETYSQRLLRVVNMLTPAEVLRQIAVMLLETVSSDTSQKLRENRELLRGWMIRVSFNWSRLIVHQVWAGMWREHLFVKELSSIVAPVMNIQKASKYEDVNKMFDFKLIDCESGQPVALFSIKSPRYAGSYSSTFKDNGERGEVSGHKKSEDLYGVSVQVVIIDHHLSSESLKESIEEQLKEVLKWL